MKIEIGKQVTFLQEKNGTIAIRRGEVVSHLVRRTPSGAVKDVVTIEYDENGVTETKVVDTDALYPSKWDAAMAMYKKVAPIVDSYYYREVCAPRMEAASGQQSLALDTQFKFVVDKKADTPNKMVVSVFEQLLAAAGEDVIKSIIMKVKKSKVLYDSKALRRFEDRLFSIIHGDCRKVRYLLGQKD